MESGGLDTGPSMGRLSGVIPSLITASECRGEAANTSRCFAITLARDAVVARQERRSLQNRF
jgi:hypothetical protein